MEIVSNIALSLKIATSPVNLALLIAGTLFGLVASKRPGLNAVALMAMLLPAAYGLSPIGGLILVTGIYCGAQSSTARALRGRWAETAGRSLLATIAAGVVVALLAPSIARFGAKFGTADSFALTVLGLSLAAVFTNGALLKSLAMVLAGVLLSTVGTAPSTKEERLTFGWQDLSDGIDIAVIALGLFCIAEIIRPLASQRHEASETEPREQKPDVRTTDAWQIASVARGSLIGAVLGILPGHAASLAARASRSAERRLTSSRSSQGEGAAGSAASQSALLPLLTLGLPANAALALFVGVMSVHGIEAGGQLATKQANLFWGLIGGMFIANVFLALAAEPLQRLGRRFSRSPGGLMSPAILLVACIGIYSLNGNTIDLMLAALLGASGYALVTLGFELSPLLIGFVLGKPLEQKLHSALVESGGSFLAVISDWTRPSPYILIVSLGLVAGAAAKQRLAVKA